MKDSEYIFALWQGAHQTCYKGGCEHQGVSRVRVRLQEFMDYRQVHEWLQKCLGKDILPTLPNRLNLEEEKRGRMQNVIGSSAHPNRIFSLHCWRNSLKWDKLQLRSISYVLKNQLKRRKNSLWCWFDPTREGVVTAQVSLSQSWKYKGKKIVLLSPTKTTKNQNRS